ncbi:MAG: SPOR domain-containing protein [Desulfovibrio sp.]|jgi:cell division septation protein DedD|nr:SPOR domain-containing protein [Desulfovibrio sp.]
MPQSSRKSRAKAKISEKPPERAAARKNRLTLSLSRTLALMLCLVFAVTIAWAFFMGYMVGRGQNPAQRVEQMTALLHDEKPAPDMGHDDGNNAPATSAKTTGAPPDGIGGEAMRQDAAADPENRDRTRVEGLPDTGTDRSKVTDDKLSGPPLAFDPMNPPAGAALAAWGEGGPKAKAAPPKAEERFDWVFQMAAFRDKTDADALQKRLENAGYKAESRRSGKVRLVLVRLRGGETDAARLRDEARKLKLDAPLLQSKKPVMEKNAKR